MRSRRKAASRMATSLRTRGEVVGWRTPLVLSEVEGNEPSPALPRHLARPAEPGVRPVLHHRAQLPGIARQEDGGAVVVIGEDRAVALDESLEQQRIVGLDPARRLVGAGPEAGAEPVFGL